MTTLMPLAKAMATVSPWSVRPFPSLRFLRLCQLPLPPDTQLLRSYNNNPSRTRTDPSFMDDVNSVHPVPFTLCPAISAIPVMAKPVESHGAPPARAAITHVLFDMDGLLLDTEKFYTEVQQTILTGYGKTFTWDLKAKMMGKKALEAGRILVQELGLEGVITPEDFIKQREEALQLLFPHSNLMPGAERLITHLHSHGVPMAIATSSHRSHYELKTTRHKELTALMHHVVVGDDPDVVHGKPAPDIFLIAARRFQDSSLKPVNVLVFEDAPTGVAAARNAGMNVVMVPDLNLNRSLCSGADELLSSLLDFCPSNWGLPPFPKDGLLDSSSADEVLHPTIVV